MGMLKKQTEQYLPSYLIDLFWRKIFNKSFVLHLHHVDLHVCFKQMLTKQNDTWTMWCLHFQVD